MTSAPPTKTPNRFQAAWKAAWNRIFVYRILIYLFGLFILTCGTTVSINARLGLSAGNCLPYVISEASGITFGTACRYVYIGCIVFQWAMMGKAFRMKNLLQILVSYIYGWMADFWVWALGDIAPQTYMGQLGILAVSIALLGLGIAVYVAPDVIVNPLEGLGVAVSYRIKKPFYIGKTISDSSTVTMAIILSFAVFGTLTGVREGTVASALFTGKAMHIFSRFVTPPIKRICGTATG